MIINVLKGEKLECVVEKDVVLEDGSKVDYRYTIRKRTD